MKKKIILLSTFILIALSVSLFKNSKKYIEIDGIKYAITVNGAVASTFPSGNYTAGVDCNNARGYYDKQSSKVIIEDVTGNVSCNIAFNEVGNSDYLNNHIISLVNQTQGDGKIVSENGYRYEGKNPNNYVWFNNELWRIIGVFDSSSHGVTDTNLVKLIRNGSIGSVVWGLYSGNTITNDWKYTSLNSLLNNTYFNATSTSCYGHYSHPALTEYNIPNTCDYQDSGIKYDYRNLIANVTWYLGGGGNEGYTTYTPDNIYAYERDSSSVKSGNSFSTLARIGLMYESDYLYGVLESDCNRTTLHDGYGSQNCIAGNWLNSTGIEWLISPSGNNVWAVDGSVYVYGTTNGLGVRPVLYLNSNVYRVSGSGSLLDPYIIGM